MKSKTKISISLALLVIFLFSGIFNSRISKDIITNNNYLEFNEKDQVQIKQSGFWDLTGNPIYIDDLATGVGAHNWTWAETQPWCSGSGSWADPYIIEYVTIDGQGSGSCIEIRNSDAYFIIRNCSLYNSCSSSNYAGIMLNNGDNGKIINNNCSDNYYHGIRLSNSHNNTLSGNSMNFCGISLKGSLAEVASHNIDDTNLVNNKPVYYYVNELGLGSSNFTNAGQIFLINCNNSIISGLNISDGTAGIFLGYSNNNTLSGNTANNNYYRGIDLLESNNNTISGNTANNNSYGIILVECNNNTISENTASTNDFGIYLDQSDNNTLSGNIASNNNYRGIILRECNNNTISGNTANNNNYGINLFYSDNNTLSGNNVSNNNFYGIYLSESSNNTLSGNTASNNNYRGIILRECNNNTISGNKISNNDDYGIYLWYSNNNKIFLNDFINNEINAEDNGINNKWDDGFTGNYWDDYEGVDANDDGIGDTPYTISGTAGSQDNFPIWTDGDDIAPVITIIFPLLDSIFGLDAPNYNISIDELNLETIWYTLDGGGTNYTVTGLTGTFNQLAWEALSEGNLTIRFYAKDTVGHIGSAAVTVERDISAPVITIIFPLLDSVFDLDAPDYNIYIDELNLDTIWYTLDGGITNYTITDLTGTFNHLAWEALSEGSLTIRFYANDTAGNIGFIDVEVIIEITEDKEIPEDLPIISFGNYYILFTFITILSFIILEKQKKE